MTRRKPRLAILHYAAPPTIGGVEATIATHARLFADHGYPVRIIAGRGRTADAHAPLTLVRNADSNAPRVRRVNAELARGVASREFDALVDDLTDALSRALRRTDVLIAHNALSLHKNLALTAALKNLSHTRRIRLIAWCHDFAWRDPQYTADLHPGAPWEWLKQPWKNVQYVVVSAARKKELQEIWGDAGNIAVVPPGIDASEFFGVRDKTARWMREGTLDGAPLLLLPARVTRRKNIELAIEITAALRQRGTNAKLIVTGPPGPHNPTNTAYLDALRAQRTAAGVEDAVVFLHEYGRVDNATQRDLYLLADALLLPSEREGFGIPILEAGLARLPIFCSDLPPFRESARDHAIYFALDQPPAEIAARLADALANDPAYQMKQRVLQEYAWNHIFAECIEPLLTGG